MVSPSQRHLYSRPRSTIGESLEHQRLIAPVKLLQSESRIGQTHTVPLTARRRWRAATVVGNGNPQSVIDDIRRHFDFRWSGGRSHPVLQRILKQRLQQELGHQRVQRIGIDRSRDGQSVSKADAHDREIVIGQRQLIAQGDLVLASMLERQSQEITQPRQHAVGGFDVSMHQRRDTVQRVEEKMRVNLRPQRFQLRLGQTRTEIGGSDLALAIASIELHGVNDPDDRPERHRFAGKAARNQRAERRIVSESKRAYERCQQRILRDDAHARNQQRQRQRRAPCSPIDWVSTTEPEEEWRKQRAGIPVSKATGQHRPPRNRLIHLREIHDVLRDGEHREECPRREDQQHLLHGRFFRRRDSHCRNGFGITLQSSAALPASALLFVTG